MKFIIRSIMIDRYYNDFDIVLLRRRSLKWEIQNNLNDNNSSNEKKIWSLLHQRLEIWILNRYSVWNICNEIRIRWRGINIAHSLILTVSHSLPLSLTFTQFRSLLPPPPPSLSATYSLTHRINSTALQAAVTVTATTTATAYWGWGIPRKTPPGKRILSSYDIYLPDRNPFRQSLIRKKKSNSSSIILSNHE